MFRFIEKYGAGVGFLACVIIVFAMIFLPLEFGGGSTETQREYNLERKRAMESKCMDHDGIQNVVVEVTGAYGNNSRPESIVCKDGTIQPWEGF